MMQQIGVHQGVHLQCNIDLSSSEMAKNPFLDNANQNSEMLDILSKTGTLHSLPICCSQGIPCLTIIGVNPYTFTTMSEGKTTIEDVTAKFNEITVSPEAGTSKRGEKRTRETDNPTDYPRETTLLRRTKKSTYAIRTTFQDT